MEKKKLLEVEGFRAFLIYHELHGYPVKTLHIELSEERRVLSTMDGFMETKHVLNHYNPPELWELLHTREGLKNYRNHLLKDLKLEKAASLFTGVDMDRVRFSRKSYRSLEVFTFATAGVEGNAMRAGLDAGTVVENEEGFTRVDTINIITLTNTRLTDAAMARAIVTVTEAKTSILQELNIKSSYGSYQATGTGTDGVVVVSGTKGLVTYTGGHSKIGELFGRAVREAVEEAVLASGAVRKPNNPIGDGFVHVYVGTGKGKTTAALGLAFRASGHRMKTYIAQFIKAYHYGDIDAALFTYPYITIEQFGDKPFAHIKDTPSTKDKMLAKKALERAMEVMNSKEFHIVVMDEVLTAWYFDLLTTEEIIKAIESRPKGVELVLTGRYAPDEVLDIADLVTDMREVKHYYQKGVVSRLGIER